VIPVLDGVLKVTQRFLEQLPLWQIFIAALRELRHCLFPLCFYPFAGDVCVWDVAVTTKAMAVTVVIDSKRIA
jgi:hypothetical protein